MPKIKPSVMVDAVFKSFNELSTVSRQVKSGRYISKETRQARLFNKQLAVQLRSARVLMVSDMCQSAAGADALDNNKLPLQQRQRLAEFVAERAADRNEDGHVRIVAMVMFEKMIDQGRIDVFTDKTAISIGKMAGDKAFMQSLAADGLTLPKKLAVARPDLSTT